VGTVWQRARSDEQKQQRKVALLDAATRMLSSQPIADISLNAIARNANISKANVYRYFESREELFLHLTLDAFVRWRDTITRRLTPLAGTGDAGAVAAAFTSATMEHETFARLSSVLTTVLERNVSTEVVVDFKTRYLEAIAGLLPAMRDVLPELSEADTFHLLQTTYFQIVALWPAAHPTPAVEAALERPELAALCVDFESTLQRTISITIAGLRAQSRTR